MDDLNIALITQRSIKGVLALVSRTFVVQIVSFVSNFLLTIFLSPEVFGVFFVVSAAIAFLSYFSDVGLAAALIQKKESLTEDDLKTTFTIQQILVLALVIVALILSRQAGNFYHLNANGVLLFQALVISFFLSSLKTIPSIILERNLEFQKLVVPQIVETFFFSVLAVFFAIKGFGVTSFTIAVLGRGISGVLAMYILYPWKIKIGLSKKSAAKLMSYGIPFQLNSFLALIKDDLLIAYLGKVLPLSQVGLIGFAQKWAFFPLRLIMDNIIRITFPSFSRLQTEKEILTKALEKSIFITAFLTFPALTGLVLLSPYFINFIPKYSKWEPALLSLGFFAVNAGLSSISTPLTNLLNAIGKIKISLFLMIFWTALTWILTPLFIFLMGFEGVAKASALISLSVVLVIFIVKKFVPFSVRNALIYPFICTSLMGIEIYFLSPILAFSVSGLILVILISIVLYFLLMFVLTKNEMLSDLNVIKENLRK